MSSNSERRNKTRFSHEAPITLENNEIGLLHGVRMYNFSDTGIYFETNFYLQPGTELYVSINSSPFADKAGVVECYRAVIKWRKFVEESAFDYGYGLQLLERRPSGTNAEPGKDSRQHQRKNCSIPAKVSTPSETFGVLIDNVSQGGIFFKTHQPLKPGQQLDLMIPLRDKGKLLKKSGVVVWSEDGSVGVQFQPPEDKPTP